MKAKTFSTTLKDLYGINDYGNHIHVGDEFWTNSGTLQELTNRTWNKVKITYIRSGVLFFNIFDFDSSEHWFPIGSCVVALFIVAKLDPLKDLNHIQNINNFRFDDKFTEVVNFDNREDKEVNDTDLMYVL